MSGSTQLTDLCTHDVRVVANEIVKEIDADPACHIGTVVDEYVHDPLLSQLQKELDRRGLSWQMGVEDKKTVLFAWRT